MNDLDWLSDAPTTRTTDVRRRLILDRRSYDVTAFEDAGTVGIRLVGWDSGYVFTEFVADLPTGDATDVGQLIASALAGFRDCPTVRPPDPQRSWWNPPDRLKPPNWGKPWEPHDLDLLVSRFREGASIEALTEELGRSDGAIRQRLQLLGETRSEAPQHAEEAQRLAGALEDVEEAPSHAVEMARVMDGALEPLERDHPTLGAIHRYRES